MGSLKSSILASHLCSAVAVGVALVGILLDGASAQSVPTTSDKVFPFLATLEKTERMATIVREASREGTVSVYGTPGIDRAQPFIDLFQKRYPKVSVQYSRLTTPALRQKVLAERQARRPGADVVLDTAATMDLLSRALAPYEATTWSQFDPNFRHGEASRGWTAMDYEVSPYGIAWRTDKVDAKEAPDTYQKLARLNDPKWRGRIGTRLEMEGAIDGFLKLYGQDGGMKLITDLAALNSRLYPSVGALSAALASGEVDVAWLISGPRAVALKNSGAPIQYAFPDPTFLSGITLAVTDGSQHPYAAALFVEFLTDARVSEELDLIEPGRVFPNMSGNYGLSLKSFPSYLVLEPMAPDRFTEINRLVEKLFVRRN